MSGEEEATLENTPTWAVATVCFILLSVSIFIEHVLHLLAKYFNKRRRKSLLQALAKIKSQLMLFGFISLLLTICERYIANICIPRSSGETFLPCGSISSDTGEESRCEEQGKISLLSRAGVQHLQYLMCVLAIFHVFSCFLTFSFGTAKMKRWKSWEAETKTFEYQFSNDPRRFQFISDTSFGRRHLQFWSEHSFLRLPACFLRQFFGSVSKVDYVTLRHGFITTHFSEGSTFDFQKYLRRALEKDFGLVVGVSPWIWLFSILFIFFNARVFYSYLWLPFIPLLMLLVVGTKLESIITKMCLDRNDKSHIVRGTLLVRPSDLYFWFGRPKLLLHLMHFILVQNSFQLAFFTWTWKKYGIRSCFHRENSDIAITISTGLVVHVLCGYVTLPLYALVTQMGTSMKKSVFPEGVADGLKRWTVKAKKTVAKRNNYISHPSPDASLETSVYSSPSFGTIDPRFSPELDDSPTDDSFVSVNIADGEDDVVKQSENSKYMGSFHGFDVSSILR